MNTQRLIVLGIALVAAGSAAFLVRGMLGGDTPAAQARPAPVITMSEVLVANINLAPGQALSVEQVRWQKWPAASVDPSFITHEAVGSEEQAVKGTVVRTPIQQGQPITSTSIVHGDAPGFMAATLADGMRAVSIAISVESSAGGFILPNDRVDVILTRKSLGDFQRVYARTILSNLRVLAVDQTFRQDKDTRTVVGKTATVELTPQQAETIAAAGSAGQLSLSLRPLSDANVASVDAVTLKRDDVARKHYGAASDSPVSVIRYGIAGSGGRQESPQ